MRLTQIKLAGFKSFTDPTTIHVPSQLVAVIGPNGCGKSNVIDAVRWVLGEASAKQLRGESMQDVIFNGAATRRPAPRASVELVFDNSDHTLQGAWGQYAEVSIKRQLTRQGDSSYYINGQPVRRRDITDLFLGTGVGARGYAVIEQGMISRIIEARPEDLRAYIEEAAGVSKYKERRRETELRLKDTREHLQRLHDLQNELTRQVEKLNAQAATAEQYRSLKAQLAAQQNQLDYAQWQNALAEADKAAEQHQIAQTKQQNTSAQTEQLNQQIQALRQTEQAQQEQLAQLNAQYSQVREQLARTEEQQRAHQTQQQRTERERTAAQAQIAALHTQHAAIIAERETLVAQSQAKQTELETLAQIVAEHEQRLPELETQEQTQENAYRSQQERLNQMKRELALKQQQLQYTQTALTQHQERLNRLQQETTALNLPEDTELATVREQTELHQQQYETSETQLQTQEAQLRSLKIELQAAEAAYQTLHQQHITAQAQQQALAQLLRSQTTQDTWAKTPYADTPAVWQHIHAPEAWQHALSVILAERLHARLLPENTELQPENLPQSAAAWIQFSGSLNKKTQPAQALINQIQCDKPFQAALQYWLDGVLCSPNLAHALTHQHDLQAHQQWLTPEGHRIDKTGAILFNADNAEQLVQQKAQHDSLLAQLETLEPQLTQAQTQRTTLREQLAQAEQQHSNAQAQHRQLTNTLQTVQNRANELITRTNQGQIRREHIAQERAKIAEESEIYTQQQDTLSADIDTLTQAVAELDVQNRELSSSRQSQQTALKQARLALLEANLQHGTAELALNKWQQRIENLSVQAATLVQQQENWRLRMEEAALLAENDEQAQLLATQLADIQAQAEELNERVLAAQAQLAATQAQGQTVYETMQQANAQLPQFQAAVQTALLQQQQALLNAQRFHENLLERGADLDAFTPETERSLKELAQHIAQLQQNILDLGAVNLAALQELAEARERDNYYRTQSEDVLAAIALLEEAIAQIDGETKVRFKETFDAVNDKMQAYFPTLFGGGEAQLQMIGDDLLTAGVSIQARPPGKRNSTIHLLSGGEKALTAMSLVFALFSLNPAPFCLLDEVDAPLDDANTSRFCNLVKEMSAQTQFLYISHNRLTMEMAEQLVGVTMQEKGVSRIVAVDIQEALQMADAA
ncbi:chromosome segregation protein SMC [Kingella negevensis]|uniref:chromosome segregation protein SMC n=1 Tax=Kingella negevensis TaxID=1522312 RepID=UPI000A26FB4E|nr:chromosome segregation protein SMC [Kingella negevensis]WII90979.1 chromosome segregation protein SMC [Kingella negevensis]